MKSFFHTLIFHLIFSRHKVSIYVQADKYKLSGSVSVPSDYGKVVSFAIANLIQFLFFYPSTYSPPPPTR